MTKATVSMALRGSPQISRETAERVRQAAGRLGYRIDANYAAQRMAFARRRLRLPSRVVGVWGPDNTLGAPYFLRITQGVWDVLSNEHYAILAVGYDGADWREFIPRDEVDGLVAYGGFEIAASIAMLKAHPGFGDRPVVVLINPVPGTPCVGTDDERGAYEACRCLIEHGHRQFLAIALDADRPQGCHGRRRRGARRALADAGLSWPRHVRPFLCPKSWMAPSAARDRLLADGLDGCGTELVAALKAHPGVTALICDNDPIALHAFASLRDAGLSVPDDLSIVGFDDTDPLPGADGANLLSSVALPLEEVGREGARLLLRCIRGETIPPEPLLLPARFVKRASVGAAKPRRR